MYGRIDGSLIQLVGQHAFDVIVVTANKHEDGAVVCIIEIMDKVSWDQGFYGDFC